MARHVVKQHIVDVNCEDKRLAQDIFSHMSFLFNGRIRDITSEVFDKVSPEELLLRFGKVEINMGRFPLLFSDEEFAEQYRRLLEESLRAHIRRAGNGETDTETLIIETPEELSQKHLLERYLISGIMPWWADQEENNPHRKILAAILQKEPAELKKLIVKLYVAPHVRKRLVYNFEETDIQNIIRLLVPAEAEFIFSYHKEVCILQKERQLVKAEETQFRKSLWLFILDFLADQSGSQFNRKMFVLSTLRALARRYNLSFEEVLFYMTQALDALSETEQKTVELTRILAQISDDHSYQSALDERPHITPRSKQAGAERQKKRSGDILFFLAYGYLPETSLFMDQEELNEHFLEMIRTQPARVSEFLKEYGKLQTVRKRIVYNLGETATKNVIQLVEPTGAETIFDYADLTGRLQKQKNIVPSEEKQFRDSLWELILDFLFSDRGSVFNAKMFLESGIRSLAQYYNIEYRRLVAFLAQGIVEKNPASANYTSLFYLLTEILRESGSSATATLENENAAQKKEAHSVNDEYDLGQSQTGSENTQRADEIMIEEEASALASALHYWFQAGSLPWWATSPFGTIKQILQQLIRINPGLALNTFKRAFASGKLSFAAFSTLYEEFRTLIILLPGGKKEFEAVQDIQNVLNEMGTSVSEKGRYLLLMALTQNLLMPGSSKLKETSLHTFQLLFAEHFEKEVYEKLTKVLQRAKLIAPGKAPLADSTGGEIRTALFDTQNQALLTESDLISFLASDENSSSSNQNAAHKAAGLIRHYLIHKDLPLYPGAEPRRLAEQLTLFLYQHNPSALAALFNSSSLSADQRAELFLLAANERFTALKQFTLQHLERFLSEKLRAGTDPAAALSPLQHLMQSPLAWQNNESDKALMRNLYGIKAVRAYAAARLSMPDFYTTVRNLGNDSLDELAREFAQFFSLLAADSFERAHYMGWIREFFLRLLAAYTHWDMRPTAIQTKFLDFLYYEKQVNMQRLAQQFEKLVSKAANTAGPARAWAGHLAPGIKTLSELEKEKNKLDEQAQTLDNKKRKTSMMDDMTEHEDPVNEHSQEREMEHLNEHDRIYINNAGMVLFHPFISHLFTRAGLLENGQFTSEESRARAALLLQYAATGREQADEHVMPLNKILCGMELQQPFGETVTLKEEEKALATDMLRAVLVNWDKMKNTSIAGLRETFLMREGYLVHTEEAWTLRVEQKAFDVLLQTIPWGLGLVKFSWMKLPLNIIWT